MSEPYVIDAADIVFFDPNGTPYAADCDRNLTVNDCIGELTELGPFTQSPWGCPSTLCPEPISGFWVGFIVMALALTGGWLGARLSRA